MKVLIATAALFLRYIYAFRSSIRPIKCVFYTYCIKNIDGERPDNEIFWLIKIIATSIINFQRNIM